MSRRSIITTGLIGLGGAVLLAAASIWVMLQGWIPPLLSQPQYVWGIFLFLLAFSLLEIPVMIFSMRRMIASINPRAKYVVMATNAGYTLFAGVYAVPFILLAGHSWLELGSGALMAALSFVRFFTSMVFLPYGKQTQSQ
jgi:hypothetical protein